MLLKYSAYLNVTDSGTRTNNHGIDLAEFHHWNSAFQVAFAAAAVKGLRYASINSANFKTVRFALDCLPRYGWEGI
jgi:hypothetical protein